MINHVGQKSISNSRKKIDLIEFAKTIRPFFLWTQTEHTKKIYKTRDVKKSQTSVFIDFIEKKNNKWS